MNRTVLQVVVQCSNPREFLFIRVFKGVLSSALVNKKNANSNQPKTRLEASKPPTYFPDYSNIWSLEKGEVKLT